MPIRSKTNMGNKCLLFDIFKFVTLHKTIFTSYTIWTKHEMMWKKNKEEGKIKIGCKWFYLVLVSVLYQVKILIVVIEYLFFWKFV